MSVDSETIREIVRQELPLALQDDPAVRRAVWQLARDNFANKVETESRFDQVLAEIKRAREEQSRKWDEQNHKWDENQRVINQILKEIRNIRFRTQDALV